MVELTNTSRNEETMAESPYTKIAQIRTVEEFKRHLATCGIDLPCDTDLSPEVFAKQLAIDGRGIGNRFCILPMEGWDGTTSGSPSELTVRRWRNFGRSGAKLIWGGEAVAVRHEGRANPNQLWIRRDNLADFVALRQALVEEHRAVCDRTDDLLIGLQLTHSGRFCRPNRKDLGEPVIAYHHPILDERFGISPNSAVISDSELDDLIGDFAAAAALAREAGFDFVDLKHCHGYLGHELLSAVDRPGRYGGSLENRTRFMREGIAAIRSAAPEMLVGVRMSIFDFVPFRKGPGDVGVPCDCPLPYRYAFGGDSENPAAAYDLTETHAVVTMLEELGVKLLCTTAGSPYYNPHIQRPAMFPPSDGYLPPEEPLLGVARQAAATAEIKREHLGMLVVGSAYTYLQEYLPAVAHALLREGLVDSIGLGRMVLSYPEFPADVLAGRAVDRKRLCRTFSDCTTAPRAGLVSGCYPLDSFYKTSEPAAKLNELKKRGQK